ncbi:alpha/beta fold hydrolase [Jejuia spongiicola]|uniref:Alpha/beta hydrolase n=1 Tax=Jejuia spongiicola TaxID=2942207 RepID=A0ABT0QA26_9FLAO|nr:alpha/beta hydrolase [Jejuia spongiicola]MCL6293478.1 alpha/beta hydrolase [Jejuia spongiicola]
MKTLKKTLKWAFRILVVLIIGILIYGTITQSSYNKKLVKEFKPNGKLVDLTSGQLHYKLIGNGEFTFVLEAGLGENMETWSKIQDSLSRIGRIFMYDRAGLGFSKTNSEPRTTKQIAQELNELLNKEKIPGPYIMVGHSIGGAHIRYFANAFPNDIVGLFLIDPSHEKMWDDAPSPSLFEKFLNFSLVNLSWSGIPYYLLPEPPHPTYKTSKSIKAYGKERAAIAESINLFKSANVNLSSLPIYILSATATDGDYKERSLALMKELINHSKSNIKEHKVYDKPHHIHVTDPKIVIADLKEFTNRIFNKTTVAKNEYN